MKLPLFCKTCDMLTGHLTTSPINAQCRKCGTIRHIPLHRWALLAILVVVFIVLSVWGFANILKDVGVL